MRMLRAMALFPLLRKDLAEMAQRRRTYVLRVGAALLLFGSFMVYLSASVSTSQRYAASALGSGRDVFEFVAGMLFAAVFVMLPATMSGALVYEKERQTMALLLLTDLRPTEILMEKYLGRLFSMGVYLLLALPLLAVAYAYGGVPTGMLASTVYMLALTCLQVGALGLVCSAFFTSASSAFIATYFFCLVLYLGPVCVLELLSAVLFVPPVNEDAVYALFPIYVWGDTQGSGMATLVARSIPILISIGFFLLMARVFVVRRAFAVPGHALRRVFRRMDRFWNRANRLTGGIVLIREVDTLPDVRPITWREVRTRSLARFSYLFRILCAVEVPVLLVVAIAAMDASAWGRDCLALSVLLFVLWPVAALALAVVAGNVFPSERVSQTMDLLLTTPLSGAEIVRQKVRALRRFTLVLAVPLVTVYVSEALAENRLWSGDMWEYLAVSLPAIVVYFSLVKWFSVWVGLRVRSRAAATIVPVGVLTLWCVLPLLVVAVVVDALNWPSHLPYTATVLSSPVGMLLVPEISGSLKGLFGRWWWAMVGLNWVLYGAVALIFRALCLKRADRYLGRVPEGLPPPAPTEPMEEANNEAP